MYNQGRGSEYFCTKEKRNERVLFTPPPPFLRFLKILLALISIYVSSEENLPERDISISVLTIFAWPNILAGSTLVESFRPCDVSSTGELGGGSFIKTPPSIEKERNTSGERERRRTGGEREEVGRVLSFIQC